MMSMLGPVTRRAFTVIDPLVPPDELACSVTIFVADYFRRSLCSSFQLLAQTTTGSRCRS
jgi:hypothetical protein